MKPNGHGNSPGSQGNRQPSSTHIWPIGQVSSSSPLQSSSIPLHGISAVGPM